MANENEQPVLELSEKEKCVPQDPSYFPRLEKLGHGAEKEDPSTD